MSRLKVQMVNNIPAVQETQVKSLGCGNPLDLEMASHSSISAWRTPWTEEPGGLYSPGCHKESGTTEKTERLTHKRVSWILKPEFQIARALMGLNGFYLKIMCEQYQLACQACSLFLPRLLCAGHQAWCARHTSGEVLAPALDSMVLLLILYTE